MRSDAPVRVSRTLPLPADAAWTLVADSRNHERWVPLTRVRTEPAEPALGGSVVATSGPFARRGAPGLVDRMRIDRWDAPTPTTPGVATFTKLGPVLLGTAEVQVAAVDATHARVTWTEDAHLAGPWPRRAGAALLTPFLRAMLRLALARAGREAREAAQRIAGSGAMSTTDRP